MRFAVDCSIALRRFCNQVQDDSCAGDIGSIAGGGEMSGMSDEISPHGTTASSGLPDFLIQAELLDDAFDELSTIGRQATQATD